MNSSQLINQDSGDFEKYTPDEIINPTINVLGKIDLDPASSLIANERINAKKIFTIKDNGLEKEWYGKVWMNHPFSKCEKKCKKNNCTKKKCKKRGYCIKVDLPSNKDWINKLIDSYVNGKVIEAICITYASTSETWFKPLHSYVQCYPYKRVNFMLPNGEKQSGVTKGSVITYLGYNVKRFADNFRKIGSIKIEI